MAALNMFETHIVTVLYVDDEPLARKYFVRSLGDDYKVLTAATADEAIDILRQGDEAIGVIVTDYRMPSRDGGDLLRQVAQEFPHVVRLVATAYANRKVLLDTVNSGEVFRILEKPLDVTELKNTLRQACDLSYERNIKHQRLIAMDETLSFVVHELNTPLAMVRNYARGSQKRLSGDTVTPKQHTQLAAAALAIEDNARFCQTLIVTFVNSVRLAGTKQGRTKGSMASHMLTGLLDSYPLTPEMREALSIDIQQDFSINAKPNCVVLVFSSILGNALRALKDTPVPKICITVQMDPNPQILITDNGPGIAPEVMELLLTAPITTHAATGGTGWGMIFCKRIMLSLGGDIQVHSTPSVETVFTLDFPAIKTDEEEKGNIH